MAANAMLASNFLKAISHEGRLMILCHLASGEKSVTELEDLLSARQAAVSQQLSRLRLEGLVTPRRDGKTIYYSPWEPGVQERLTERVDIEFGPEDLTFSRPQVVTAGLKAWNLLTAANDRILLGVPSEEVVQDLERPGERVLHVKTNWFDELNRLVPIER